eukprot:479823-Rhodomonas_salina.3
MLAIVQGAACVQSVGGHAEGLARLCPFTLSPAASTEHNPISHSPLSEPCIKNTRHSRIMITLTRAPSILARRGCTPIVILIPVQLAVQLLAVGDFKLLEQLAIRPGERRGSLLELEERAQIRDVLAQVMQRRAGLFRAALQEAVDLVQRSLGERSCVRCQIPHQPSRRAANLMRRIEAAQASVRRIMIGVEFSVARRLGVVRCLGQRGVERITCLRRLEHRARRT